MKTYFIYYTFTKNGNTGDGNIDVTTDNGINDIDDIRLIESVIKEKEGYDSIVINNYLLLSGS